MKVNFGCSSCKGLDQQAVHKDVKKDQVSKDVKNQPAKDLFVKSK